MRKCPTCNGNGFIMWRNKTKDCPQCQNTGLIADARRFCPVCGNEIRGKTCDMCWSSDDSAGDTTPDYMDDGRGS